MPRSRARERDEGARVVRRSRLRTRRRGRTAWHQSRDAGVTTARPQDPATDGSLIAQPGGFSLPAVCNALVGDVADVVRIETLGPTVLLVAHLVLNDIALEGAVDLRIWYEAREEVERAKGFAPCRHTHGVVSCLRYRPHPPRFCDTRRLSRRDAMRGLDECTETDLSGDAHEHNHDERRHDDLLQGLGQGTGRHALARLAAER